MSSYDQFGSSSAGDYGTDANFQANYRLTPAFVAAHKAPFPSTNRIWIGGYDVFQTDIVGLRRPPDGSEGIAAHDARRRARCPTAGTAVGSRRRWPR